MGGWKTSAPNTSCVQNTNEEKQSTSTLSKHPFIPSHFHRPKQEQQPWQVGRDNKKLHLKAVFYAPTVAWRCEKVAFTEDALKNIKFTNGSYLNSIEAQTGEESYTFFL